MELLFRIMVGLQTLLAWLLTPFFRFKAKRHRRTLPKITNEILKCSATTLAQNIREKKISCVEVTKAYIDRIQAVNPIVNAVVEDRFTDALDDAEKIDKIIANNELSQDYIAIKYPLFGIPLTVKQSCGLKGLSGCMASKKRIGMKMEEDGEVVRLLKDAGAIPLLVSNIPEICCGWETSNLVTGRTSNPYNTGCTSGGSSGGEGALLGCGASVIGVGTDIAGSIRLPAMFNGVFGHKPTPKLTSINGLFPTCPDKKFPEFLVTGPLTRYAKDLTLMMKIISENPTNLNLDETVDLSKLKVFFMYEAEKSIVLHSVDEEIKTMMDKCLEHLTSNCGSSVSDYKFDMRNTCEMSASLLYKMDDIPNVLRDPISGEIKHNLYLEFLKKMFGMSEYSFHGLIFHFLEKNNVFVSRNNYDHYQEKAKRLKEDFIEKLGKTGVFLYPTFPVPAFEHDKILFLTSGVMYTMVFNALGLPATNIPLGKNKNALPIGIQVVAAPYQDRLCLAIAEELEACFGGWTEP